MNFGEQRSRGGLVLLSDDGKTHGIHPRWAKVYAVGPEQKDVKVGQWILMEHGRWTRGIKIEDEEGEKIIRLLKENDGYLPYYDKSEPDDIYSFFSMSKKTFKMTIGNLYKQKKLSLEKTGIRLID